MEKRISGGFDLRINLRNLQRQHPSQVNQWLSPEKRSLISADASVWIRTAEVSDFLASDPVSYPLGLWGNLDDLVVALHAQGIETATLTPLCLTISEATAMRFYDRYGTDYFKNAPNDEQLSSRGWSHLGFDTVELNGLISGLKGCGYTEPSWSQLRAQFGSALNEVGLFSDEVTASKFADARGREISSHAPFDVVGVLVHAPPSE